jgi:hypothetical protein
VAALKIAPATPVEVRARELDTAARRDAAKDAKGLRRYLVSDATPGMTQSSIESPQNPLVSGRPNVVGGAKQYQPRLTATSAGVVYENHRAIL